MKLLMVVAISGTVLLAGCSQSSNPMPSDEQAIVKQLESFSGDYQNTDNGIQQDSIAAAQEKFLKDYVIHRRIVKWVGTLQSIDTMLDTVFLKIHVSDDVTIEDQIDEKAPIVSKLATLQTGSMVQFSGQITEEGSITSAGRTTAPEFYIDLKSIRQL